MAEMEMTYKDVSNTVETIKKLVKNVADSAQNMMDVSDACIKRGIQAEWALELSQLLGIFQKSDVYNGLSEMTLQADKLTAMQEKVQRYEQSN